MNAQTPAKQLRVVKHPSRPDCLSVTDGLNHLAECASYEATATPERLAQIKSDAALFVASYTAFDQAGRELGIDAAELARTIPLAEVIRYALDYAQLHTTAHDRRDVGRPDQVDAARVTLAKLADALKVTI